MRRAPLVLAATAALALGLAPTTTLTVGFGSAAHAEAPATSPTTTLAATAATPKPPTTAPASSGEALRAAAGWLAGRLTDGDHMRSGEYDDYGLTVDAIWAFSAAGVAGDAATKATTWLAKPEHTAGYVGDGTTESYAGAHAKLALLALTQGRDPESFGGRKLLTELGALRQASGRYSDKSQWDDYSNIFSQSLAIIAVQRAEATTGTEARTGTETETVDQSKAIDFLLTSQCADGAFPQNFGQPTCIGSVDATGMAVQALMSVGRAVESTKALDWLMSRQRDNGGFNDGAAEVGKDHPVNANSTSAALQGLRAGGRTAAADKAAAFIITGLRVGCSGPVDQRGAITYDGVYVAGSAPRATSAAVLGLGGVSLAKLSATGASPRIPAVECAAAPASGAATSGGAMLPVTGPLMVLLVGAGVVSLMMGVLLLTVFRRHFP